jgi:hypothetical protein
MVCKSLSCLSHCVSLCNKFWRVFLYVNYAHIEIGRGCGKNENQIRIKSLKK